MKGAPGGSWRDFGQIAGGSALRSAAWARLVEAPLTGAPLGVCRAAGIASSVDMFLNALAAKSSANCGASLDGPFGQRKILDGGNAAASSYGGADCYRRAALDFVTELAGPRAVPPSTEKVHCPDSFVCAEELPVPMFAVDRDMHCTVWNRRLSELSGWTEGEVMVTQKFVACTFSPDSGSRSQKSCEDELRAAMFGRAVAGGEFVLRTKGGRAVRVLLCASRRTDALGAVSGVLCAVLKQSDIFGGSESATVLPREQQEMSEEASNTGDVAAAEFRTPSPPSPVLLPSQVLTGFSLEDPSPFESKEVFARSLSSPESSGGSGSSSSSGWGSSRALVVDGLSASRNLLAAQLERCGMEVACAASAREAAWLFEQSLEMEDGRPPFGLVFVELKAASRDGYMAVREMRRLERRAVQTVSEGPPLRAVIVAVASMNRWDLAGMDNSMDKGMSAGVDAVIPQNIKMQQLRSTLRKLGVRSKYLDVPTTLPRALSGSWHNPLNLSR